MRVHSYMETEKKYLRKEIHEETLNAEAIKQHGQTVSPHTERH